MQREVLRMVGINKSFPGVKALNDISLTVEEGEVLALIGENGAGKSTLMKILSGVYTMDSGEIYVSGQPVHIDSPLSATSIGISIIYQELNQMPNLSIAENIFMGREKASFKFLSNKAAMEREAEGLVKQVGLHVGVSTLIGSLSIAQRQMVEVAKALSMNAKIIIMDEPTSSLTDRENEILMDIIRGLREHGVSVVFISHKLNEIFQISDRITVLRDGKNVGTVRTSESDEQQLIEMMVGRSITEIYPPPLGSKTEETVLQVENICTSLLKNVSFSLQKGEILGFSGLVGAGRTELMNAIFGVDRMSGGAIMVEGQKINVHCPNDAIDHGIGFVPEDRKLKGLIMGMTVRDNITLACLAMISKKNVINQKAEGGVATEYVQKLNIKTPGIEQTVQNLSGGNQQKVVVSKWLTTRPKILILDEPTRGIDVGAKKEIYTLMRQLTAQGMSIIMVSSELSEILGMSDRIIVMHDGTVKGELPGESATQQAIMQLILKDSSQQVQQKGVEE